MHVNKTTEMLELTVQISHPVLPQLLFPVLRNMSQLQPQVIIQWTCGQRFCVTCSNCIKHCVMQECVSIISCCGSYYNKCISPGAPASERCDCLRHVADRRQHAVTREHISWLYCLIVFSQVCVKIIIITNTNWILPENTLLTKWRKIKCVNKYVYIPFVCWKVIPRQINQQIPDLCGQYWYRYLAISRNLITRYRPIVTL